MPDQPEPETDEQRTDREETEREHAAGIHTHCGLTCEVDLPTEHLRNFIIAKGYPGTKGALDELLRRAAAPAVAPTAPPAADLRDRIAALFRQSPGAERLGDATPGEIADAVLAALMERNEALRAEVGRLRTNRATVLNERADFLDGCLRNAGDPSSDPRYWAAVRDVAMGLRQQADEAQQPETKACTCQYIAEPWIKMQHSSDCPAAPAAPTEEPAPQCSAGLLPATDAAVDRCIRRGPHDTHKTAARALWPATEETTP